MNNKEKEQNSINVLSCESQDFMKTLETNTFVMTPLIKMDDLNEERDVLSTRDRIKKVKKVTALKTVW